MDIPYSSIFSEIQNRCKDPWISARSRNLHGVYIRGEDVTTVYERAEDTEISTTWSWPHFS